MNPLFKKIIAIIGAIVLIIVLNHIYGRVKKTFNMPANNKVVIIDAGHGGRDAGASGAGGLKEKDVNLEIAKRLKRYIEEGGGVAIMIREGDNGLYSLDSPNKKREDMKNRKQIIKENDADMLISIHLNSFPQRRYYGAQVFYFKDSDISRHLAAIMQQELKRVLDRNNNRVEKSTGEYFILKDNDIPSVLIECGFLSNPDEERLLGMPEYQEKIAWSMYIGIIRFFSEPKPAIINPKTFEFHAKEICKSF
jgi:N-acetylmuramoyl-L-alanine amidase